MSGGRVTAISPIAGVGRGTTIINPKSITPKSNLFILLPSLSITDANVLSRHYNYYDV